MSVRFSSVKLLPSEARIPDHSAMPFGSQRATFRLASLLATVLVAFPLSSCGHDDEPSADRCSSRAKPASAGQSVTWSGIEFNVPVGWYPVDVCFATTLAMPLGYLTTQTPHAQCHENACGAPVNHLGASDVEVLADQSSTSLMRRIHPNTTVAGLPAQIVTRPDGQFGAHQTVEAFVLLPHHEVLHVTAYLGPHASSEPLIAMIKGGRAHASA
jgi:hypothetical protein